MSIQLQVYIVVSLLTFRACTANNTISRRIQVPNEGLVQNVDHKSLNKSTPLKVSEEEHHQRAGSGEGGTNSASVRAQIGSLVSTNSNVHIHHQRRPGFHLDYAPPRTHPPAHN